MLIAGALWGVAIACSGWSRARQSSLLVFALAGVADVTSVVCRTTIVQLASPPDYLGRVNAAQYVVGSACPQLGNFRAGVVGSLTTPAVSATLGGSHRCSVPQS